MSYKFSKYITGEKTIELNFHQMLMVVMPQKNKFLEGPRGSGKSTGIAWQIQELANSMPKGAFTIVGATYSQILTRTLPATIAGLEMFGYKKDVHFFVKRKAPAKWKWQEAYQPPLDYEHAIHWYTGAVFHLVSMDLKDGGRGLNVDGVIGDEAALLDYDKLFNNVLTTIRGNKERFKKCALHQSTLFVSSVPMTNRGNWLLQMEKQAKEDPKSIFYLRAHPMDNAHNLPDDWFTKNERILPASIYNAEILNIRPGKIEGGFYPTFNEVKHCRDMFNNSFLLNLGDDIEKAKGANCLGDGDLQPNKPIDIACDYNAAICTIVANQDCGDESRWLNAMYVKAPVMIDVLINNFCDYYEGHKTKIVNYYYDQTAIGKDAKGSKTYNEIVAETFTKRGWRVINKFMGAAPTHRARYIFWGIAFQEGDKRLPKQRFNTTNCKYLIVSLNKAGVRQGRNGEEKDKRPETAKNAIDEETTHFSDALDTLGFFKYESRIRESKGQFRLP